MSVPEPDFRFVISTAEVEAFLQCGGVPWRCVYVLPDADKPSVPLRTWLAMTGRSARELQP